MEHDTRFGFSVPNKRERYIYPFSFEAKTGSASSDKKFLFHNQENSENNELTCELSDEQVRAMLETFRKAVAGINWETYGKVDQYDFVLPEKEYACCYSAGTLEAEMNGLLLNQRIVRIYIEADDYMDPLRAEKNFLDLWGERVLLEFGNSFVDFAIITHILDC